MITIKKAPRKWNAAHSPILYEFDYQTIACLFAYNAGNMLTIIPGGIFTDSPVAGQFVYVTSGRYQGYHLVSEYSGGFITTTTEYSGTQASGYMKVITQDVFTIAVGYGTGEIFETELPYTEIAEFNPEPGPTGLLSFDIHGYLNKIFDVMHSYESVVKGGVTYYPNLFNRFRLISGGAILDEKMVINSALSQADLNAYFVETGRPLTAQSPYELASCGDTIMVKIGASGVLSAAHDAGLPVDNGMIFNNDFNNDFKLTP